MTNKVKFVENAEMLSAYKNGFQQIGEMVNGIDRFTRHSTGIFIETIIKANEEQLGNIQQQRTQLEIDIKEFLAYANSKMNYLNEVEAFLLEQKAKAERMAEEARKSLEEEQQEV
ncbi:MULTISPECIES: hypothetical protein [Paenibacillus]|uniref:Uncharacterized protein n=1 Tax=Paenibacillus macerans TaxID=44252 RepID=A0A090Z9H8_PAEMA|nr:hypothetical protein [Paenibacillus macerans]KFN07292.1 hypothetical protein DJ90_5695 [Paenibacillus macerans]MCY7558250.1 hypothetical protein [Paenibacillus macerans]MEC0154612.1 hypothetical protein [Paenibacillus macerans]SUA85655.1 Uncharacterised protein [Paenibacillus macerans]